MGLLDAPTSLVKTPLDALGNLIANPFSRKVGGVTVKPDFADGFEIIEYIGGVPQENESVQLLGNMMPLQPFPFGGKQRIKKDYYPGHSEPTVQVLGPEESDIIIKGKLKDKRYKEPRFRGVATEIQEKIDAIRIRGNVVKIRLGEFRRFGFLEQTDFKLNTLAEIEYELKFSIIGFNPPTNCKFTTDEKDPPFAINKALIAEALAFQSTYSSIPASMPASLADLLNDAISDVAGLVGAVTGFVDKVFTTGEDLVKSANRALGLIKNARAAVSIYQRRVGAIVYDFNNIAPSARKALQVTGGYANMQHITNSSRATNNVADLLARLEAQFKGLSVTVPLRRHLIKNGDTLQNLAIKYYNDANLAKKIYDHNKLTTTLLQVGKVLEIPKL